MSVLRVSITADGARRKFVGIGDGPNVVAAFRVWLSSSDFWFPMCEGADAVDAAADRVSLAEPAQGKRKVDPPKSVARSEEDRPIKSRVARRLLDEAFCVPGFHSLGRLASCASDLGASMIDVKCALDDLVTRGAICARTVGTERQWAAQARPTTEARS